MSTKNDLFKLLSEHQGDYVSGQYAGDTLNVSRNAIWKAVTQLRDEGYNIESSPKVGYRLAGSGNMLTEEAIWADLHRDCDLKVFSEIDSTNNYAMQAEIGSKPLLVVADKQTAGRGRNGRSFISPSGTGLYLSIAFRPDFDVSKALFVTMAAAVAVCRSIESVCGVSGEIKWVNDVFAGGKKVCGILTEAKTNFETGRIDSLIIGIGINCFPGNFPDELKDIAGPVSMEPDSFSRSRLAAAIFDNTMALADDIMSRSFFDEYRKRCFILGRQITVHPNLNDMSVRAIAMDIDEDGGLMIKYLDGPRQGETDHLTTGEVSISVKG